MSHLLHSTPFRVNATEVEEEEEEVEVGFQLESKYREKELIDRLHDLYEQLEQVRQTNKTLGKEELVDVNNKIIVVAARKPVKIDTSIEGEPWVYQESAGGFMSAIATLEQSNKVVWVSWPATSVDASSEISLQRKLISEYNCYPVFLPADMAESFFNKFCQEVLWTNFHEMTFEYYHLLDNFFEHFDAYQRVNQMFLDTITNIYQNGDLIIIYNYELMLLPSLLRKRFPDSTNGHFFHCPFPSTEFYRMLPFRENILQGVLGADLIGFNSFEYVRHFLNACTCIMGLETFPSKVEYNRREVTLSVCPLGINPEAFSLTSEIETIAQRVRNRFKDSKIIISLDRLDHCKGIAEKLIAFDRFLEKYADWRGKVVFFLVMRTRGKFSNINLSRTIDTIVGRVNGRYGKTDYCPVMYIKRSLSDDEVKALYSLADVAIVTSLKESVNLWSMEMIATQSNNNSSNQKQGVLICSEFVGCAKSMKSGALLVNPYDTPKLAEVIRSALIMGNISKKVRHQNLWAYININSSTVWANKFVSLLKQAQLKANESVNIQKLNFSHLRNFYERSALRLLVFNFEGTLTPYQPLAQLLHPSPSVISCLNILCNDHKNVVIVTTERSHEHIEKWLGHIDRIILIAEGGYWARIPSQVKNLSPRSPRAMEHTDSENEMVILDDTEIMQWEPLFKNVDLNWKKSLRKILQDFTDRTPGSILENYYSCLNWHFRDCDPDYGRAQVKLIQLHFEQLLETTPARLVTCSEKKYIHIRPSKVNTGRAILKVLNQFRFLKEINAFDLALGIADERADEELFDTFNISNCFTCVVGSKLSHAQFFLESVDDVVLLLQALNSCG